MNMLVSLVAYLHPSRQVLAASSRKEVQALLIRNCWWFVIGCLLTFSVRDPQGNFMVALWDAIVTVSVWGSLLEGMRLMRWYRAKSE